MRRSFEGITGLKVNVKREVASVPVHLEVL
jgi:hypothetical protein